jgi:hypothetical protein
MLKVLGDTQIPLLAVMLLGGFLAKMGRSVRQRSLDVGLGPTALFPIILRPWAAAGLCIVELGLGLGLIATGGRLGAGGPAELVRLGTALLFVVASCALIELRSVRPDLGCGCFGELSATPVTCRTLVRSALLAAIALASTQVKPITEAQLDHHIGLIGVLLAVELAGFGLLSPETRAILVRIGYATPCEMRLPSAEHTLAALLRSSQWRRHQDLIASDEPSDTWRELCWRYVSFPSSYAGRDAEVLFAVRLQQRRPVVLSVLVDATTGVPLPWPSTSAGRRRFRRPESARPAATALAARESAVPGQGASEPAN